jgi:hypothetical protein
MESDKKKTRGIVTWREPIRELEKNEKFGL